MFSRLSEKSSDARILVILDSILARESLSIRTMAMTIIIVCGVDGRGYVCASCGFVVFMIHCLVDWTFVRIAVCIMFQ